MYILSSLFLFFITACFVYADGMPEWYKNASIQHYEYEIIGYGEGVTISEAEANARSEIAKSIAVAISSALNISSDMNGSELKKRVEENIKESSSIVLSGLEKVKQHCDDGRCFVALKYVNLPFVSKIKKMLEANFCDKLETNSYLISTNFYDELFKEFQCYPKLKFFNKGYLVFVEYNGVSYYLSPKEFLRLFVEVDTDKFTFSPYPPKKYLRTGDTYYIKMNIKSDGNLSVYQISQEGGVKVLMDNEPVLEGMELVYPDVKDTDGLEVELTEGLKREVELNMAVLCPQKINNSMFEKISKHYSSAEGGFGILIQMIDNCYISSFITEIGR